MARKKIQPQDAPREHLVRYYHGCRIVSQTVDPTSVDPKADEDGDGWDHLVFDGAGDDAPASGMFPTLAAAISRARRLKEAREAEAAEAAAEEVEQPAELPHVQAAEAATDAGEPSES